MTMRLSSNFLKVHLNRSVRIVACIHLVLILYGLTLTIQDIITLQNPFSIYETTYVSCYYLLYFGIIILLVVGTQKRIAWFLLPWLAVFLVVFSTVTCLWLKAALRGDSFSILTTIMNISLLGFGWLCWYIVLKTFIFLYTRSTTNS